MQATSAVGVSPWRQWRCSALAAYALAGGAVSFLGWALDIPRLTDWFNAGISIQPNSTVLLMAAGVALILLQLGRHRLVLWLGAFIGLMGALSLLQHVVGADFGFNHQLTFGREWGNLATVTRGRVGPPGSTSFTLIGVALLLLAYCEERPQRANLRRFVPLLGLAVSVITLFSLVGYALGAEKFYALPSLSAIALQTATLLLALGIALVASVTERQPMQLLLSGSPAGTLARRILPALVFLPPLLAWLETEGASLGLFDEGTGRSLLTVAIVLLSIGSMWCALRILERQEQSERESAECLIETLESINDGFVRLDAQWRCVYVNKQAEILGGGMDPRRMLGRAWDELVPAAIGMHIDREFERAVREQIPVELENYYEPSQQWFYVKVHPMADGGLALFFQDITDRKRAEEALRRSEEQFASLFNATSVGMAQTDPVTRRYLRVNAALCAITGYGDAELLAMTVDRLNHPDDRERDRELYERLARAGSAYELEKRYLRKDGEVVWVHVTGDVVRDGEGHPVRAFAVIQDITERKRAEDQLGQTQKMLFELVERCPFGIYIVDSRFRIAHMNAGSQTGAFVNVHPVIGRDFAEAMRILWPEPVAAEIIAHFRHTLETGEPYYSREFIRPRDDTGVVEAYEWELHRLTLPGDQYGVVCYYFDSTELREIEMALRRQKEETEELLLIMPAAVWIAHDPECRVVTGNAYAQRLLPQAAKVRRESGSDEDLLQSTIATGVPLTNYEYQLELTDGRMIDLLGSTIPLFDERGRVRGAIAACLDITALKQAQQALRDAARRKDEFLALLAHELRNPLAPVRNAVKILRLKGPSVSELDWARDVIDRQVQHMTRLIDDLLDVSRISQGKIRLKREHVELTNIVQRAVEASRPLIERHGHELVVDVPPRPAYLHADATRLVQVLCNLLDNAAKYSEHGGRIVLTAARHGREAVVTVRDFGIGLAPDLLPKVFDMFAQAEVSSDKSQGGLGLGLTLVKRFVEMHGGQVEARSEGPGKGSEFAFRLPLLEAPSMARQSARGRGGPLPPFSTRIVVVDDNRDAADSLAMMLRLMGNEVRTAYDGPGAVTLAAQFRPDVVLLDIGLPEMNGYDTARAIRTDQRGKSMVLVAVTGWGQEDDLRRSKDAGFDHHLVKPVDPDALLDLLASCGSAARYGAG